jgi:signal transduction histidine kinase
LAFELAMLRSVARRSCALLGLVLLVIAFSAPSLSAQAPQRARRVLILYENESTLPAAIEVARGLQASMQTNMPANIELYSEYLDTVRFSDAANVGRLAAYLASKYSRMAFDVVIAIGPGALTFALEHRADIGTNAPIVFGAVADSVLENRVLPPDVRGVVSHFDVRKTIDLAAELQPDARQIAVMTGSSGFDDAWKETARAALTQSYRGLPVTYLSGLSMEGFKDAARKLPRQSILLILSIFQDGNGQIFIPRDTVREIAAISSAPVYGVYSTYIGAGAVGGYVGTFDAIGQQMGVLAAQAVKGEQTGPQVSFVYDGPLVDWPQIAHWGIDPNLIPKAAAIQNFSMSPWRRYRTEILTILAVILLQSATIVALFVERRRKIRLQSELALERLELAYLSRTSQLGELSGALAHELNQPLTSILANAEAGSRLLDSEPLDMQELRAILDDIVLDDRRAATVITQLRSLMIRGETQLEPMDLNQAVTTTLALARSELLARQTRVDAMLDMPDVPVLGNLAQLQQVILNLVLNAADAMAHLSPSLREIVIQTRRRGNQHCELTVTDRGEGIAPERRLEVFKPFVSTKKSSLGLGLAICRSIVQAHGGDLLFDENFENGAKAVLTLPSAKGDAG